MTVQPPALAVRAGLIATIAAVLAVAMVFTARADAASGSAAPVLAPGAGMGAKPSVQVRRVQRALQRRGYDVGASGVDGRFGPRTAAAVRRLQAARGLAVDGVVGKRTRAALGLRGRPAAAARRGSTRTSPSTASEATRPNTVTTSGPHSNRSSDVVGAVVLWGLLAALAALALGGLARWRSRAKSPRGLRNETVAAAEDTAPVSATGGGEGFPPSPVTHGDAVIGYVTTSTDAWSAADEASATAIEATCEDSAWNLVEMVCDRQNGRTLDRPGLSYALDQIAEGRARGLVVSDLQGLSRSPTDLGELMEWFRDVDATLLVLDTAEPRRSQHPVQNGGAGARLHGPPALTSHLELTERITAMRSSNMTLEQIADQFNAESIPTLPGGREWRPSSIQTALGYRRPGPHDRLSPLHDRGGNGG